MTLQEYLDKLAAFADDQYGRQMRKQFADHQGWAERAMLNSPTADELEQLSRAVAIMTPREKAAARDLTDEQITQLAEDAKADPALLALFFNGYALLEREDIKRINQ